MNSKRENPNDRQLLPITGRVFATAISNKFHHLIHSKYNFFILAQTPRLIFHNKQLQLTKFERHLRYPIKWRQWRGLESRLLLMTNVNFYNVPHLCCQLGQFHIPVRHPRCGCSSKRFSYRYSGFSRFSKPGISRFHLIKNASNTHNVLGALWGISWVNYIQFMFLTRICSSICSSCLTGSSCFLFLQNEQQKFFSRNGHKVCKAWRKLELNKKRMMGLMAVLSNGKTKYEKPRIHLHLSLVKISGKNIFNIK